MKTYIGIDVGKLGGIVSITKSDQQTTITTAKTPIVNNEIDLLQIKNLIQDLKNSYQGREIIVGIEAVSTIPGTGANSNFQFGRSLGLIEGLITGIGIPFIKIHAKKWQKLFFEGIPVTHKPGKPKKNKDTGSMEPTQKVDTKAMALCAAKRLYPQVNLLATERSSVPHEGIVDSLGIAHYLLLNH